MSLGTDAGSDCASSVTESDDEEVKGVKRTYKGLAPGNPPKYLDPQDPVFHLGFVNLEELKVKGLYTPEQLAEAHRAMLFPRNHELVVQQIVSDGTSNYQSSVWRAERMLDENFHETMVPKGNELLIKVP